MLLNWLAILRFKTSFWLWNTFRLWKCEINFQIVHLFSFYKRAFSWSWASKLIVLIAPRKSGAETFILFLSSSTCSGCITAGVEIHQMGVCPNIYNPISYKDTPRSIMVKNCLNKTFNETFSLSLNNLLL